MPTYEYACKACGEHLEVVQSFSDDALTTCPNCEGELRKVFSAAGIIFKGSGWHIKDYKSGGGADPGSKESASQDGGSSKDADSSKKDSSKKDSSKKESSGDSGSKSESKKSESKPVKKESSTTTSSSSSTGRD